MQELTTTSEVIDALGGNRPVRALTGRTQDSAVSNWRAFGVFPPDTFVVMTSALARKGCKAPVGLWQQVEAPQELAG